MRRLVRTGVRRARAGLESLGFGLPEAPTLEAAVSMPELRAVRSDRERGPAALITGAASGIGAAVVRELADAGYRLGLIDSNADGLDQVAAETSASWQRTLDLRDVAAAMDAVRDFGQAAGRLDLLVNNAAVVVTGDLFAHTTDAFDDTIAVNTRAPLFCTQAAAELMRSQGAGCIINVASTSGIVSPPHPSIAYDISKAGIRMLTASAARELGPLGIRVCGVAPGTTETPMVASITSNRGKVRATAASIPLGRLALPEEVAHVIAFLASPAASYLTGHTWLVDGGRLA